MIELKRRSVLIGATATAIGAPLPLRALEPDPIAEASHGKMRGVRERGVCIFRGIPYGASVSGLERRFKAPPPPPSWAGIFDATRLGAPAVQPTGGTDASEPMPTEDCLFLNIWTPAADGRKRPVMFYSHGGGFTVGSGGRSYQDGANLAREQDVVVVASNHRLGLFGYLYLGQLLGPEYQANQGLLDIVAALGWVKQNISAFGGDADNVMIFGESGGGGKTACLYAMPTAAPLFHKASIESPIGPEDRTAEQATETARQLMKALDLRDARQLLQVPAATLLAYQTGSYQNATPGVAGPAGARPDRSREFWPIIDGQVLPELPFKRAAPQIMADKPLIIGGCKDEAVFFNLADKAAFNLDEAGLYARLQPKLTTNTAAWIETFRKSRPSASPSQLYMAISTATPWRAHAVHIAETKASQARAPVFSYILNYPSRVRVPGTDYPLGSPHASDIPMKFNNVTPLSGVRGPGSTDQTEARHQCARNMSAMWAAFARTGQPQAPGQPNWPSYTLERRETMLINADCRVESDPEGAERRFWETQTDSQEIR